jgi:hypothetical protein
VRLVGSFDVRSAGCRRARDPYIRDKFTRDVSHARKKAQDYLAQYPKDLFETEVESWRDLQCSNIEFTMKRLREPKPS